MFKNNSNLLFRQLNIWFAFIAVLFISSHLSHWQNVSSHAWINQALYFLLYLLATTIFLKEGYNKDIFFNLSLVLLALSFSFLNIFIGNEYLFGNDYMMFWFFGYKKLTICFLFNFFIIYVVLKYIFSNQKVWKLYLYSLIVLLPVFVYNFYPYIKSTQYVFIIRDTFYIDISKRIFFIHTFSLFFIFLYGFLLYKTDKIIGEYINPLMAFFFIFLITDMVDKLSEIFSFRVFSISLYILTFNLIFLCGILLKKLFFLCTEYGQFYETLIQNKARLGNVQIQRRHSKSNAILIKVLKLYFYQRRNYLITLSLLTAVGFGYFRFPAFFTINVVAFASCFIILFWFVNTLYKRREQKKYILPFS